MITLSSFGSIYFIFLISVSVKTVNAKHFFITTGTVMLLQNINLIELQLKNTNYIFLDSEPFGCLCQCKVLLSLCSSRGKQAGSYNLPCVS